MNGSWKPFLIFCILIAGLPSPGRAEEPASKPRRIPVTSTYRGGSAHTGFYPGGLGKGYVFEDDVSVPRGYMRILFVCTGSFSRSDGKTRRKMASSLLAFNTKDGALLWKQANVGNTLTPPAVAGGKVLISTWQTSVFQSSRKGGVLAFAAETGKPLWKFSTRGAVTAAPSVAGNAAFFGSGEGKVFAVSLDKGKRLWEVSLTGQPFGPVTVEDGVVLALFANYHDFKENRENTLLALDAKTGKELWKLIDFGFRAEAEANPFEIHEGSILCSITAQDDPAPGKLPHSFIASLDLRTGKVRWKKSLPEGLCLRHPSVLQETVVFRARTWIPNRGRPSQRKKHPFVLSEEGALYAAKCGTGEKLWAGPKGRSFLQGAPVLHKDRAYHCTLDKVLCLDLKTGEILWKAKFRLGYPVIARNHLYLLGMGGRFTAIEGKTGRQTGTRILGGSLRGAKISFGILNPASIAD